MSRSKKCLYKLKMPIWIALCLLMSHGAYAAVSVQDDTGQALTFARTPQRIIALAPHITELVYAVGAGAQLVATDSASDYPLPAKNLPRVGDYSRANFERIAVLKPDLIIGWLGGNRAADIYRLKQMGIPVMLTDAHRLSDVARLLRLIGVTTGHTNEGDRAAQEFETRLSKLKALYAATPTRRVFYQIWDKPLITVGGRHWINDAVVLCGGKNIFADLTDAAPRVSLESVVSRAPEIILSGDDAPDRLNMWRRFARIPAVRRNALIHLKADTLHRPTPRVLEGVTNMCTAMARAVP